LNVFIIPLYAACTNKKEGYKPSLVSFYWLDLTEEMFMKFFQNVNIPHLFFAYPKGVENKSGVKKWEKL
jgi:hypothetical protein